MAANRPESLRATSVWVDTVELGLHMLSSSSSSSSSSSTGAPPPPPSRMKAATPTATATATAASKTRPRSPTWNSPSRGSVKRRSARLMAAPNLGDVVAATVDGPESLSPSRARASKAKDKRVEPSSAAAGSSVLPPLPSTPTRRRPVEDEHADVRSSPAIDSFGKLTSPFRRRRGAAESPSGSGRSTARERPSDRRVSDITPLQYSPSPVGRTTVERSSLDRASRAAGVQAVASSSSDGPSPSPAPSSPARLRLPRPAPTSRPRTQAEFELAPWYESDEPDGDSDSDGGRGRVTDMRVALANITDNAQAQSQIDEIASNIEETFEGLDKLMELMREHESYVGPHSDDSTLRMLRSVGGLYEAQLASLFDELREFT